MNPIVAHMEDMRRRKGITKTHIARHCGHSVTWYQDIAKGRRKVYLDDAILIAEAVGADFFSAKN